MKTITWEDFEKVHIHVGTILRAETFPEARKPSIKMWIDFGEHGVRQSSAQVTARYTPETLVGRQVVAVLNFPTKNIAGFESQCLVTGFEQEIGTVILIGPDELVPNGSRLF